MEPQKSLYVRFAPPLLVEELVALWYELYRPKDRKCPVFVAVSKCMKYRPNSLPPEEFFEILVNELCIRFLKYYNSSFRAPMARWLYMASWSTAQDFLKNWVPGFRYDDADKPTGFIPLFTRDHEGTETFLPLPANPTREPDDISLGLLLRYELIYHLPEHQWHFDDNNYFGLKPITGEKWELLLDYLLPAEDFKRVEKHVWDCERCTKYVTDLDNDPVKRYDFREVVWWLIPKFIRECARRKGRMARAGKRARMVGQTHEYVTSIGSFPYWGNMEHTPYRGPTVSDKVERRCGHCGQVGHNARSHKRKNESA